MRYRPEIDGLRAVAVIGVLLYHLDVEHLVGGFVGVDVFFVISGFLITSLVLAELDDGRFRLLEFYRRRVRRLFPALFVVLVATSIAAPLVLFPSRVAAFRDSMISAVFFTSNFYFWRTSDYFAAPAAERPLLHTWSLAVEEQYYLLFPLLLMLLVRTARRHIGLIVGIVTGMSFVASSILVLMGRQSEAFYLFPARAWELGAGALLAIAGLTAPRTRPVRESLSWAGVAAIALAYFALPDTAPFPGPTALAPVLGACALIWAGGDCTVGAALRSRGMVRVGLLSYSLYLWHWPVIVFYRSLYPTTTLTPGTQLALATSSLALAWLSWRLVERPTRRLGLASGQRLFAFATALTAACLLVAFAAPPVAGLLKAQVPAADELAAYADADYSAQLRSGTCFISSAYTAEDFDPGTCLEDDDLRPDYLLLGDSFAGDLWAGWQQANPQINLMQATASGCKPLLHQPGEARCVAVRDSVLDTYLPGRRLAGIVLSAHWEPGDVAPIEATTKYLRQFADEVVVVGPRPLYSTALPNLLAREVASRENGLAVENLLPEPFPLDKRLASEQEVAGYRYVSPVGVFCRPVCEQYARPGVPLQFDYGHFTLEGATILGRAANGLFATP